MNEATIWGMIHVPALPGSYKSNLNIKKIIEFSLKDAKTLIENGIGHLFIENFWDVPFPKDHSLPHVVSAITVIVDRIKTKYPDVKIGVNVLRNDAISALGIATICECHAIRVNVLTHGRLTDQGIIEGIAHRLKSYGLKLGSKAEIWADVDVKHSAPLADISIEDAILDSLERGGADKIIFSGVRTGEPVDYEQLRMFIDDGIIPKEKVVIGSGINSKNIKNYLLFADNLIVGSSLKQKNILSNPIDPAKVKELVDQL